VPQDQTITMRLPADENVLDRADRLAEVLGKLPEYRALRMSRSAVLRICVLDGLDGLEKKYKINSKRR